MAGFRGYWVVFEFHAGSRGEVDDQKGDILLKLRKVEIVGFKSFCERTVVTFSGSGTTCIVGPNGCGKSNVVDAISWVLGEQSHKSLRAERMADCIFNGTTKRPPLGLAEVTITMEDPELAEAARFVMESAASETATDSATLVTENSENSGLTDVTEILSLDPAQSPETQEAAADGSALSPAEPGGKFKRKRKLAEKPVPVMRPGEVVVSRRLYRSGQSEYLINGRVGRLRDIQEMFMGVGLGPDSYAIIEQGRIGLILSTKPMERRAIIEEAAGVTKFKTKKRLAEAKLESSKVNLSRVNDIVVEVEKQLGSLKRQAAKARRYSEIRDQMRGIVRQMLAGKARELDAEAERTSKLLEELTAAELQRATAIQQQEGEQDRLNQRIYELDAEIRQNQNVLHLTAPHAERAAHDHESATGQLNALKQSAAELQAKIARFREQRDTLSKEAATLRDSLAGVRARHSTLTQILNDRSYTADAVQKLFAANERSGGQDFRAVGVLADYAEVEEQHEAAIEQYLRDELEYVVVETYDHARAGVSMLRDEVGGRATFFVDSLRNVRLSSEYEPIVNFRAEDGVISRLDKLVEFRDPLGAAAKQFLPRLRSAYLTNSTAAAEKLSRENSQYAFLTPDGTCYQGRMVTGGRPDEVGPLGMKRELRALDAEMMQLEHAMSEKHAALEAVAVELRSTEQALEAIDQKQREAERDAISAMHRHGQMQGELARLGLELAVCQNELARIRKEVENARQRAEGAKSQHAAAALSRAEADAESVRLAEALVQLRGSIQSA